MEGCAKPERTPRAAGDSTNDKMGSQGRALYRKRGRLEKAAFFLALLAKSTQALIRRKMRRMASLFQDAAEEPRISAIWFAQRWTTTAIS